MIKKMITLLLCFAPSLLFAQVTISAQLPPGGMVQKDQLWNLILVNNKEGVIEVSIKMNVQDAANGQVLMSANSGSIMFGKGVKIITSRDVEPVMYNFNSPDFSKAYLPMGSYVVCYQVYKRVGELDEPLGDECIRINIDPLSPPLLSYPSDKSTIETPYPQFTWMPPTPIDLFSNLSYDLLLTEVNEGQSPVEAIEYNTPVYSRSNISQTTENYPTGFAALEKDKTYAWQVVAMNGTNYAAKTEVWTFKITSGLHSTQTPDDGTYIRISDVATGVHILSLGKLHVKLYSFDKAHDTKIEFEDERGKLIQSEQKRIIYGENFLDFDLSQHLSKGHIYKLKIQISNNQYYTLQFEIK